MQVAGAARATLDSARLSHSLRARQSSTESFKKRGGAGGRHCRILPVGLALRASLDLLAIEDDSSAAFWGYEVDADWATCAT